MRRFLPLRLAALLAALLAGAPAVGAAEPAPVAVEARLTTADTARLRPGDLVFHRSTSAQSAAIAAATRSPWTHVGVVLSLDGALVVVEAIEPISRTPLATWIARGEGGRFAARRLQDADTVLTPEVLGRMEALARGWLGVHYDAAFGWSDERLYCSELVHKLFERAAGVRLGRVERLGDFDLAHPTVRAAVAERYGRAVPLEEPVVSPASLYADGRLVDVP